MLMIYWFVDPIFIFGYLQQVESKYLLCESILVKDRDLRCKSTFHAHTYMYT